jgi:calmodulin
MKTVGVKASPDEVSSLVAAVDRDGSGEVDFGEFIAVMGRKVDIPYTPAQVKAAFRVFQLAGETEPGTVRAAELSGVLAAYAGALGLSPGAAEELVAQMEPDAAGVVQYTTYVDMMMGTQKK